MYRVRGLGLMWGITKWGPLIRLVLGFYGETTDDTKTLHNPEYHIPLEYGI